MELAQPWTNIIHINCMYFFHSALDRFDLMRFFFFIIICDYIFRPRVLYYYTSYYEPVNENRLSLCFFGGRSKFDMYNII